MSIRIGVAIALSFAIRAAQPPEVELNPGAFGDPVSLKPADEKRFEAGRALFEAVWQSDYVGRRFNARSCVACHREPMTGGSGSSSGTLVFVGTPAQSVEPRFEITSDGVVELARSSSAERRRTPPLFGSGFLQRVPEMALPHEGNLGRYGRFGSHGQFQSIVDFVRAAFRDELGLRVSGGVRDISDEEIALVAEYIESLGVPPRKAPRTTLQGGDAVFAEVGCARCHLPRLPSSDRYGGVVVIAPFTDLRLHDIGTSRRAVRTAPLWGIGSTGPPYLHDGSAASLHDAILRHGAEAAHARNRYAGLSDERRTAMIEYLRGL